MIRTLALGAAIFIASAISAQSQVVLKFASPAPAPTPVNKAVFQVWADKVTQESGGTLKVEFFPGAQLGQHGQMLDHVRNGVVDIAFEAQGYYPGKFKKSEVVNLPFLFENAEQGTVAYNRLLKTGLLDDEYKDVFVIHLFTFPNPAILTKDSVRNMEEMKGQKLAAIVAARQAMMGNLGAIPVSTKIQDWYQSINRGVLTGVMESLTAVRPFRLNEVTKHVLEVPLGGHFAMIIMNRAKFDSLPDQAKKAITENSGEAFARMHGKFWDNANEDGRQIMLAAKAEFRTLNFVEMEKWKQTVAPVVDDWAKSTPNGSGVLETFKKIILDVKAGK